MVIGLLCIGAGIALAKVSATGTTAISCIAAVVSFIASDQNVQFLTLGLLTCGINIIFLIIELVLLGPDFNPVQFLQIPVLLIMTGSIDLWMVPFSNLPVNGVVDQAVYLILSVIIVSLGTFCEVTANVVMIPGNAVVAVISYVFKLPYSKCKVGFDSTLTALGFVLSIAYFKGLYGVGIGTIASAVFVGILVKMWRRLFDGLLKRLDLGNESLVPPVVPKVQTV